MTQIFDYTPHGIPGLQSFEIKTKPDSMGNGSFDCETIFTNIKEFPNHWFPGRILGYWRWNKSIVNVIYFHSETCAYVMDSYYYGLGSDMGRIAPEVVMENIFSELLISIARFINAYKSPKDFYEYQSRLWAKL